MSKQLLKLALQRPEKVASSIARSLLSAAGSGLGAAGTFKLLSALRPELAEAALWGGVGAGGVLGHDVAKHLANKAKVAAWAKKKAAMEKPFKTEYSLVKNANLLARAAYLTTENAPAIAAGLYGSRMGAKLLPDNPIIGGLLGALSGSSLVLPVSSSVAASMFPKSHKFLANRVNTPAVKIGGYEKRANLSRAAKGAIGLPAAALALGHVAAATHMPGVADDMVNQLTGGFGKLEEIPGILKTLYGPLKVPAAMGVEGGQILSGDIMGRAGASLAGLSALGAGAGKLSEKITPVAKKSLLKDPERRNKLLLLAALFPWISTTTGTTYLYKKLRSDS